MTGVLVALTDAVGTFGWVAVWLITLVAGVACIFRGRSGAGACLGFAAILGLALQICGGSITQGIGSALTVLPFRLGWAVSAFVASLGDAVLFALLAAGVVAQRRSG